jgi:hypothetical protein
MLAEWEHAQKYVDAHPVFFVETHGTFTFVSFFICAGGIRVVVEKCANVFVILHRFAFLR